MRRPPNLAHRTSGVEPPTGLTQKTVVLARQRQAKPTLQVVIVRMRWYPPTIAYIERHTTEGLTKEDIIRCLKRLVARELYHLLPESSTQAAATDLAKAA